MTSKWPMVRLGDFVEINPQKSEARKLLNPDDPISFLPMEDLGVRCGEVTPIKQRRFGDVQSSYTYFRDGDVLLAKITPCFENGKIGIARNLVNGVGFGSSEYLVIRNSDLLLSEYVYYAISRNEFIDQGKRVMTGSVGHKRVPKDYVSELQIPLPPLDEQKRIVAKLDEAQQNFDRLNNNLEHQLGQLTDFDRALACDKFMIGESTNADENHHTSCLTPLRDVATWRGGMTPSTSETAFWENGTIPWISSKDVKTSKLLTTERQVTGEALRNSTLARVESGSVAVVVRSGVLIHTFPVTFVAFETTVNQDIKIGTPNPGVDGRYLAEALIANGRNILRTCRKQGATVQSIEFEKLMKFGIYLPSLDNQKRLVAEIDEAVYSSASLRSNILSRKNSSSKLQSSILAAAFAGAL